MKWIFLLGQVTQVTWILPHPTPHPVTWTSKQVRVLDLFPVNLT